MITPKFEEERFNSMRGPLVRVTTFVDGARYELIVDAFTHLIEEAKQHIIDDLKQDGYIND